MTGNLRAVDESGDRPKDGPPSELHLLVIDPRSLTRDCLIAAFEDTPTVNSVTATGNAQEAAAILTQNKRINTALFNLASDAFDDAALSAMIRPLRQAAPRNSILLLTTHTDADHASAALRLGIDGYLSSDMSFELTADAIRIVSRGWMIYPRSALERAKMGRNIPPQSSNLSNDERLTLRQGQVLEALTQGMTNREIANRLMISEGTVKAHVKELMRRLGASNRTQVVAVASNMTSNAS